MPLHPHIGSRQKRWLEEHPGVWRRVDHVDKEISPLGSVPTELDVRADSAGRNDQTSFREVRGSGDDKKERRLVDPIASDRSPWQEPNSLHTPPTARSEAKESKTDSTPLGPMERKRGRNGRQIRNQRLPGESLSAGRKRSPAIMRKVFEILSRCPIMAVAARTLRLHPKTLAYWMRRSEAGIGGYDVEWQGITLRFHEHCKSAIEDARILQDGEIIGLARAALVDQNGNALMKSEANPKMALLCMEHFKPERWCPPRKRKPDPMRDGGVLIVHPNKRKVYPAASIQANRWKALARKIQKAKK